MQRLASDVAVCFPVHLCYPYPDGAAEAYIENRMQAAQAGRAYTFALLCDETFVGLCSLHSLRPDEHTGEIAFWVGRPYWGRGYGHAAVTQLLHRAFVQHGLHRVTARTLSGNAKAIRLLERLGFERYGAGRIVWAEQHRPVQVTLFHRTASGAPLP